MLDLQRGMDDFFVILAYFRSISICFLKGSERRIREVKIPSFPNGILGILRWRNRLSEVLYLQREMDDSQKRLYIKQKSMFWRQREPGRPLAG